MMSALALKILNDCARRARRTTVYNILRLSSTDDHCSSKQQDACHTKTHEQTKPDHCSKHADPSHTKHADCSQQQRVTVCSEAPPCPPMPRCPPTICNAGPDRNNPCNYCPPACIDPDYPDLTRLKKFQCLFQQDDGLPIFLKRGNVDALIYQGLMVLVIICVLTALYSTANLVVRKK